MKIIFLVCFFSMALTLQAHQRDTVSAKKDSTVKKNLKYYFQPVSLKDADKGKKLDFQIDSRNSFVKDFPINVYGLNLGVVLHERFRIGVGYYWINQNFNNKLLGIYTSADGATREGRVIINSKGIPIPVSTLQKLVDAGKLNSFISASQQIDLWFASVGFMYTFYSSRLIELAIPVEIGYGNFSEKLYDVSGNNFGSLGASPKPGTTQGNFIPGQVGIDLLIKPHRWIFLEGSYGYRQTLNQNYTSKYRATSFDSQFNGAYYNVGVKVQLGTIIKEWKHRNKKSASKTEFSIKE